MVTDLVEIRTLAERHRREDLDFRRYLSAHHHRVEEFQAIAASLQPAIDCKGCANCCRETLVNVSDAEISAIAEFLGMEPAEVTRLYTMRDPEPPHSLVLLNDKNGCTFLDGNLCMIYEARPKPCREFPHTASGTHSLGGRVESIWRRASICPIVFNALEEYKRRVPHPEHPHPDQE